MDRSPGVSRSSFLLLLVVLVIGVVAAGNDGKILVKCWAGCPTDAVLTARGLKMADLMGDRKEEAPAPGKGKREKGRIVAEYDYTDADGNRHADRYGDGDQYADDHQHTDDHEHADRDEHADANACASASRGGLYGNLAQVHASSVRSWLDACRPF
jgi:hypothetical protein